MSVRSFLAALVAAGCMTAGGPPAGAAQLNRGPDTADATAIPVQPTREQIENADRKAQADDQADTKARHDFAKAPFKDLDTLPWTAR